jgi:hypothetical protein
MLYLKSHTAISFLHRNGVFRVALLLRISTLYCTYWTEKSPRVRNLIVNWVVDLNDKTMEGMFTREDWEAISSWAVIF